MKISLKIVFIIFFVAVLVVDCKGPCACGPEPRAYYYFFYKSASNPDLLQPQTGVYNPSNVRLYELINNNGAVTQNPAPELNGQYFGMQNGVYFINYQSSIFQYQKDLKKTLIQLSPGITDTLTYTFIGSSSYPQQIFYNSKSVWKIGDGVEITIVK